MDKGVCQNNWNRKQNKDSTTVWFFYKFFADGFDSVIHSFFLSFNNYKWKT